MNKLLGIVAVVAILLFFVMTASGPGSRMSNGWSYLTTGSTTLQNSGLPAAHASGNDYRAMARQDAIDNHIDPDLFERQINQESGFNPRAESLMGAQGIAQFMPTTAQGLGIDPWNAEQALQGAARLMASYNRKYGDYSKALSAYNYGSANTDSALARCGWNWKTCVPQETQRYIINIMN